MTVFVTGGTGFLGQRLVSRLLARGLSVRCLVRSGRGADDLRGTVDPAALSRLDFCLGSLDAVDAWAGGLVGCAAVVHLAAEMRGAAAVLFASNVVATRRLVDVAARAGVGRFVLVSSLAVYDAGGLRRGAVLDEDCPVDPHPHLRDPYTYSKVAQEAVAWEAHRAGRVPVVVVRPGVIYGPGRDCLTGRVGLRLGRVLVRMGGRQALPYTFVDNCAAAVALAVTAPGVDGEAFNVVDDDLISGRDLVRRYRAAVGRLPVIPIPGWAIGPLSGLSEWYHRWSRGQLPAVITRYRSRAMWKPLHYNNAKAKARLGWQPAVGFDAGLRSTFTCPRPARPAAPNRPLRILFLTSIFPRPYAPQCGIYSARLCEALAAAGHDVRVIAPQPWPERLRYGRGSVARNGHESPFRVDDPVYYYPPKVLRRAYGRFMWLSIRRRVRAVLAAFTPDCVVSYWAHPDGESAVRAARLAGVPAAVMVGGSDVLMMARRGGRRAKVMNVLRAADRVVTIGRDLRAKVIDLGVTAEKVHAVDRGVDVNRFSPGDAADARRRLGLPADGKVLLWVGRMVPVKGLDVLLTACGSLAAQGEDFFACLVGDGPLRPALESDARARGLGGRVRFIGPVDHDGLADWYRAADVTVLPSRSEGVPNVLRESLACGTPFVASRVGGVPELPAGPDSRLVPPDDPSALADALAAAPRKREGVAAAPFRPKSWAESAEELLAVLVPLTAAARRAEGPATHSRPRRLHQMVRSTLGVTLPRRMFLTQGPTNSRAVCLTFDDGPHPEHTPRLLDVLKEQRLTATFFVVGREAERHPDIVRRIVADGHSVGNHTFTHAGPTAPARDYLAEVRRTGALLSRLTGSDPPIFRPPHGKLSAAKLWRLWRDRRTVVLWNADPRDYACRSAAALGGWFRERPPQGGDIVLLHDNQPHAVRVVPEIARAARDRGLEFTTPLDWIGRRRKG